MRCVVEMVTGRDLARPARIALVAAGPTAAWAEAAAHSAGAFDSVLSTAEPDDAWLADAAARIRG